MGDGAMTQGPWDDRLLTVAEVAQVLRVSSMTVYRMITDGRLIGLQLGRAWRIRARDLERFLAQAATRPVVRPVRAAS